MRSPHILVVDDVITNQQVAVYQLTCLGCTVALAADGQEALDYRMSQDCDLILMDCQMPVMDGYVATQKILAWEKTQAKPHVPIVALTANVGNGERERCLSVGMDDYLPKPADESKLKTVLKRWLPWYQTKADESHENGVQARASVVVTSKWIPALASAEASPFFDEKRMNEIFGGDQAAIQKFIQVFVKASTETLQELEVAIQKQDASEAKALSHRLKGACASAGAMIMSDLAIQLDAALANSDWPKAEPLFLAIQSLLSKHF